MTAFLLRASLAASAVAVSLTAAHAQQPLLPQPPAPAVAAPPPRVIQWPGGWMTLDGREMILRHNLPGAGPTNIISGSGNGFGNKIVVGGGSGGGTTIISNSRNGIGNRIVLDPNDWLIDLDEWVAPVRRLPPPVPLLPAVEPQPVAPPVYEGKATVFWQQKAFSDQLDCNIYWSAADKLWYRYHADCDKYKPLKDQPPAPQ